MHVDTILFNLCLFACLLACFVLFCLFVWCFCFFFFCLFVLFVFCFLLLLFFFFFGGGGYCLAGCFSMIVLDTRCFECLIRMCFVFCICPCSEQSSMIHMERRSINTLIITIIIIAFLILLLLLLLLIIIIIIIIILLLLLLLTPTAVVVIEVDLHSPSTVMLYTHHDWVTCIESQRSVQSVTRHSEEQPF